MKVIGSNHTAQFVKIETDPNWLRDLRIAGKCVSSTMVKLCDLAKVGVSLIELDKVGEEEILKQNCKPTFLQYKGFPNSICLSVNKQLVHGIPSEYELQDGDLLSIDFGATYNNAIADSATTIIIGKPKSNEHNHMIEATKKCLRNAIGSIKVGEHIGVIGNAIHKTASKSGFNVISSYGGHGICSNSVHSQPFISNKANKTDGVRITDKMTMAIEPLLIPRNCSVNTKVGSDKWTVMTDMVSSHEEHTIYIHNNEVEVITGRDNEDSIR